MAKQKEKTELDKKNWMASFNLVGTVKLNQNTFQLDARSQKSDWVYSRMNLAVDCGTESGVNYASMMGGYGDGRDNIIYKFVNNESIQIDWDDRFDEDVIKEVPDYQVITVGIEKDSKGKTFYRRFLSEYDAIQYVSDHLEDGTVVNVRGNLQYREYNGNITTDRSITSIALSTATEDKFRATFTQSILVEDDAIDGKEDPEKGTIPFKGYVLEKLREYNGWDLTEGGKIKSGKMVPILREFEYKYPKPTELKPDLDKKAISYLLKPKKNTVNQITMEGYFVNGGAVVAATVDDLPDDVRGLIAVGILTEEEALTSVAVNGPREHRWICTKPHLRKVTNDDGTSTVSAQIIAGKYTTDDLDLPFLHAKEDKELDMNPPEDPPFDEDSDSDSDDSSDDWLNDL